MCEKYARSQICCNYLAAPPMVLCSSGFWSSHHHYIIITPIFISRIIIIIITIITSLSYWSTGAVPALLRGLPRASCQQTPLNRFGLNNNVMIMEMMLLLPPIQLIPTSPPPNCQLVPQVSWSPQVNKCDPGVRKILKSANHHRLVNGFGESWWMASFTTPQELLAGATVWLQVIQACIRILIWAWVGNWPLPSRSRSLPWLA